MHAPYTYYLYHKPTGKKYYGVRFAKDCNPNDLWKSYFTSSKKVKFLLEEYGVDSFDYEIRKIFTDKTAAIMWEQKVLRRLYVKDKKEWLNVSHGRANENNLSYSMLGRHHSEEAKHKISVANKQVWSNAEFVELHSKKLTGIKKKIIPKKSEETRKKMSIAAQGRDMTHLIVASHSPEAKEKRRKKMLGQKRSEESRKRMSDSHKGKPWSEARRKKYEEKWCSNAQ